MILIPENKLGKFVLVLLVSGIIAMLLIWVWMVSIVFGAIGTVLVCVAAIVWADKEIL